MGDRPPAGKTNVSARQRTLGSGRASSPSEAGASAIGAAAAAPGSSKGVSKGRVSMPGGVASGAAGAEGSVRTGAGSILLGAGCSGPTSSMMTGTTVTDALAGSTSLTVSVWREGMETSGRGPGLATLSEATSIRCPSRTRTVSGVRSTTGERSRSRTRRPVSPSISKERFDCAQRSATPKASAPKAKSRLAAGE